MARRRPTAAQQPLEQRILLTATLCLLAMQVIARGGLDAVRRASGPLLAASFVMLLLVKIPHVGVEVNGARRWLGAGPLQFQPSELMKISLVLYAARVLADKPKRVQTVKGVLSPLGY